jgi:hypothetical protein
LNDFVGSSKLLNVNGNAIRDFTKISNNFGLDPKLGEHILPFVSIILNVKVSYGTNSNSRDKPMNVGYDLKSKGILPAQNIILSLYNSISVNKNLESSNCDEYNCTIDYLSISFSPLIDRL